MEELPEELRTAIYAARDRGNELRRHRKRDELPHRHGPFTDFPARETIADSCGRCWTRARIKGGKYGATLCIHGWRTRGHEAASQVRRLKEDPDLP